MAYFNSSEHFEELADHIPIPWEVDESGEDEEREGVTFTFPILEGLVSVGNSQTLLEDLAKHFYRGAKDSLLWIRDTRRVVQGEIYDDEDQQHILQVDMIWPVPDNISDLLNKARLIIDKTCVVTLKLEEAE